VVIGLAPRQMLPDLLAPHEHFFQGAFGEHFENATYLSLKFFFNSLFDC